jgi:predicted NACHT family NTPase
VLDMTQPIGLGAIYTAVNILEKITGRTRRQIPELMRGCKAENFDRFSLGHVQERQVDGLEAVASKKQLMILGRPGAGKTTFLKRLATLCNRGEFLAGQVPVFVSLKEFAETINQPGLLNFIAHYFLGVEAASDLAMEQVQEILKAGRGLVLLDGLDEVLEKDHDRVLQEVRRFAQEYDSSHVIITCRIAAKEYVFEQFVEVEMADFNDPQIQDFADKWFRVRKPEQIDEMGRSIGARLFWQALEEQEPIKELAKNPLLLTLLCLEFEESSAFPQSRAELYERGLNILLSKWDGQRRIQRDEVYKRLPIKRKEIMLGQLARHTFERGEYFFGAHVAEQQIGQYIQNLPDANTDPDALLVDSRAVLKAIESQHGLLTERATDIYSFSHLTFHEYFTAKSILEVSDPDAQKSTLHRLAERVAEKRWREVFLLTVERMENADYLLTMMLERINKIVGTDKGIQRLLSWMNEKATSVDTPYKSVAVRAFYFFLDQVHSLNLDLTCLLDPTLEVDFDQYIEVEIDFDFDPNFDLDRTLSLALSRALSLDEALNDAPDSFLALEDVLHHAVGLDNELGIARSRSLTFELKQELQALRDRLQSHLQDAKEFKTRHTAQGEVWAEQLRTATIAHRNIGHDWQFSFEQHSKLGQYYDANLLLAECLIRGYLSNEARQRIEDGILMPTEKTKKLGTL